jgi:hypothetical protein
MPQCPFRGGSCPFAALEGESGCGLRGDPATCGTPADCRGGALAAGLAEADESRRDGALRAFAMMAGAAILARASDPETARRLLAACQVPEPTAGCRPHDGH